jgi:hypothetical protein
MAYSQLGVLQRGRTSAWPVAAEGQIHVFLPGADFHRCERFTWSTALTGTRIYVVDVAISRYGL